jgi:hypothetical protein
MTRLRVYDQGPEFHALQAATTPAHCANNDEALQIAAHDVDNGADSELALLTINRSSRACVIVRASVLEEALKKIRAFRYARQEAPAAVATLEPELTGGVAGDGQPELTSRTEEASSDLGQGANGF